MAATPPLHLYTIYIIYVVGRTLRQARLLHHLYTSTSSTHLRGGTNAEASSAATPPLHLYIIYASTWWDERRGKLGCYTTSTPLHHLHHLRGGTNAEASLAATPPLHLYTIYIIYVVGRTLRQARLLHHLYTSTSSTHLRLSIIYTSLSSTPLHLYSFLARGWWARTPSLSSAATSPLYHCTFFYRFEERLVELFCRVFTCL